MLPNRSTRHKYQQPRRVKFKSKIDLLKRKSIQGASGIYLIVFSIFFAAVSISIERSLVDRTLPKPDYDRIRESGRTTNGKIISIDIVDNITVNEQHPAIIAYNYRADNREIQSRYQIFSPDKIASMKVGDEVQVKYLGNESIIDGFEPYAFPFYIFPLAALAISIVGGVMLLRVIGIYLKELSLYRYGKVCSAELISVTSKSGSGKRKFGQTIMVHYSYKTSTDKKVTGESLTTDRSVLNGKKPGDNIRIFVSRDDETVSCFLPDIELKRNDWRMEEFVGKI